MPRQPPARPKRQILGRRRQALPEKATITGRSETPPCSPPPTRRPPPTGTPRKPHSRPGSGGSRPRRTPRSSNSKNSSPTPAIQAYWARIRARFAELHDERERLEAQLKALATTTPQAADTSLLDQLPLAGDILPGLPPQLKARLFAAFDISILWNKPGQQATVNAEITETTLRYLAAILDPSQDGYHDTHPDQPEPVWDLDNTLET